MIELTGSTLTIDEVVTVARSAAPVAPLGEPVIARMQASKAWLDNALRHGGEPIYGVTTGFGPLARAHIAPEQASRLSRNLILNCAAGVGPPLPADVVRAMMLIRANTLAKGLSGARPIVPQTLIAMLNAGVTPYVPSKGSLGASGDLAPQAHVALVLTRGSDEAPQADQCGQAWYRAELLDGALAMRRAGIARFVPDAKEGLALTNGTDFMVGAGALALHDAASLVRHAEIAAALSLEALLGLSEAFHPALHEANGQPGQVAAAASIRALIEGSRLIDSDRQRVQDAYSLRCIPQVLGPVRDVVTFLRERFAAALNGASDNPLLFVQLDGSGYKVSGGNFHGQGPSLWLDMLAMAMATAGSMAERRVFRLLTPELSEGLPAMLVANPGLDSGLMIPQYTAAALVSDNKTLAHPDSADSIPSGGNQEDFNSMGANSARHAMEVIQNVRHIIAIELLTAAQAIDLRQDGSARLGFGTAAAYDAVRRHVTFLTHDRPTAPDIVALADLIASGELLV